MSYKFYIDQKNPIVLEGDDLFPADFIEASDDRMHVLLENKGHEVQLISCDLIQKTIKLRHLGTIYTVVIQDDVDQMVESMGLNRLSAKQVGDIMAPMPGKVLEILVESGQEVEENTPLLILEAMKMENVLKSPSSGTVQDIHTQSGTTVGKGQILISKK